MPLVLRRKKAEEAETKVKERVKVDTPIKDVVTPEVDANKLLLFNLSSSSREAIAKDEERYGGIALGARMALAAALHRVKFIPSPTSYAWSEGAVERLTGAKSLGYDYVAMEMIKRQRWAADRPIIYAEDGFSKSVYLVKTGKEDLDRIANDLMWFNSASIAGYLVSSEALDKLSNGDKALLVSTFKVLDEAIKIGDFKGTAAVVFKKDEVTGKEVEAEATAEEYARSRPLMDGYIRVKFDDPGFEKFDRAVAERIREVAKERGLDEAAMLRIYDAVKDCVHAFAPAYYNMLNVDAWRLVPKAVAEAVADMYSKYRELQAPAEQILKSVPEDVARYVNVEELVTALLDKDPGEFARKRLPFLIDSIGKHMGTAIPLEEVIKAYEYKDMIGKGAVALSLFLYEKLGVFINPRDLSYAMSSLEAGVSKDEAAKKVLETVNDSSRRALWTVRAAFYALGAPATKFIAVRDGRPGEWYEMPFVTQVNIRQFVDLDFLREEVVDPVTGKKLSVLPHLVLGFEKALNGYEAVIRENVPKEEVVAYNPSLYRGLLYLYSDLDLVRGDYWSYNRGKSTHTELLEVAKVSAGEVQYLKDVVVPLESAEALEAKKRGDAGKYNKYVEVVKKAEELLWKRQDDIAHLATPYNPKYIEFLGFASERIYNKILGDIEKNIKSGGGGGAVLQELTSVEELAKKIAALLRAIEEMQSYEAFIKHVERERLRQLVQDDWSLVKKLGMFFKLLERLEEEGGSGGAGGGGAGGGGGAPVAVAPPPPAAQPQAQVQAQAEVQQQEQQQAQKEQEYWFNP